jgi:hypothetical protein
MPRMPLRHALIAPCATAPARDHAAGQIAAMLVISWVKTDSETEA